MHKYFASYTDLLSYLDNKGLFHVDLSLDRMYAAIEKLSLTHLPYVVVQVLGTNGKGSTSAFLAAIMRAHGISTGFYSSPHFLSPRERIEINGEMLQEEDWCEMADVVRSCGEDLTYFEFITLLAIQAFCEKGVQGAVFEAGLGGAHDATTAIDTHMHCFTPIALDHGDVLGKSLYEICHDKAQAIGKGSLVVIGRQYPLCRKILLEKAEEMGARSFFAEDLDADTIQHIALFGEHQRENAALAVMAWNVLSAEKGWRSQKEKIYEGLQTAYMPGRLQYVPASSDNPPMLLDGAHNPHGIQTVVHALKNAGIQPTALLYACLKDKDWQSSLRILRQSYHGRIPAYFPQLSNTRAGKAEDAATAWYGRPTNVFPDPVSALRAIGQEKSSNPLIFVTGSLYLLAELYAKNPSLLRLHGILKGKGKDI